MPTNPHDLKTKVVDEGLKNAGLNPETDEIDAMQAIGAVGDPTLAGMAGLVISTDIPIILGGGNTKWLAVCAIVKSINPNFDFSRINFSYYSFCSQ